MMQKSFDEQTRHFVEQKGWKLKILPLKHVLQTIDAVSWGNLKLYLILNFEQGHDWLAGQNLHIIPV